MTRISDKATLLKMLEDRDLSAMVYASPKLRNDKEVVLLAVGNHGDTLGYASKSLKNDKQVVLTAVKQNGFALHYASDELQNDKYIVLEAVKQSSFNIKFASPELQRVVDKEDPVASLERMIASEKLATRLSQTLKQKTPKQERAIKI